jgi:hypothetical protein
MTRRSLPVLFLILTAISGASGSASATEVGRGRDFGLGLAFGNPSAIVGKVFAGSTEAIDFGLGFRNHGYGNCNNHRWGCGNDSLSLHADYLRQDNLLMQGNVVLDWHLGGGGRVWFYDYDNDNNNDDDLAIAARMPVGIDLMFRRPSFLELYLEIAPSLWIYPGLDLRFDSALGIRAYF